MNTVLSIFIGLLSILGWQTSLENYRQEVIDYKQQEFRKQYKTKRYKKLKIHFDVKNLSPDKLLFLARTQRYWLRFESIEEEVELLTEASMKAQEACYREESYCWEAGMLRVLSQRRYRDFHNSVIENSKMAWREVDRLAPSLYQDFFNEWQKTELISKEVSRKGKSFKDEFQEITTHSSAGTGNNRNIESKFRILVAQEKYTKLRRIFFENLSLSYLRNPPMVPPYTGALPEPIEEGDPYRMKQVFSGTLTTRQAGDYI